MNITPEAFEEINCRLEAIEAQRNRALADHAIAAGRLTMARQAIAVKEQDIEALKKQNAELEAKLASPDNSKGT